MQLTTTLTVSDTATPALAALQRKLTPDGLRDLRRGIAGGFRALTQNHIRQASRTRHKTAERLGAKPTNYLARAADTVEALPVGDDIIRLNLDGEIFKRTFGPVTIKPRTKKFLAIPISAESHAKRAAGMSGLFVIKSKKGNLLLCRKGEGNGIVPLFTLKRSVTLPQDRGLLPSDAQFLTDAESSAKRWLHMTAQKAGLARS